MSSSFPKRGKIWPFVYGHYYMFLIPAPSDLTPFSNTPDKYVYVHENNGQFKRFGLLSKNGIVDENKIPKLKLVKESCVDMKLTSKLFDYLLHIPSIKNTSKPNVSGRMSTKISSLPESEPIRFASNVPLPLGMYPGEDPNNYTDGYANFNRKQNNDMIVPLNFMIRDEQPNVAHPIVAQKTPKCIESSLNVKDIEYLVTKFDSSDSELNEWVKTVSAPNDFILFHAFQVYDNNVCSVQYSVYTEYTLNERVELIEEKNYEFKIMKEYLIAEIKNMCMLNPFNSI